MSLDLSDAARDWFARKGYDPDFGARPMARVIQRELKDAVAEAVLFGELQKGGLVRVDVGSDDKLTFEFEPRGRTSRS